MNTDTIPPPAPLNQPHSAEALRAGGLASMRVCKRLLDAGIDLEGFPSESLDKLIEAETIHVLTGTPSPTAAAPRPAPAATPSATAAPGLPPGVFPAPPGSRIHPDGKIRTLDGKTFTPCSASGVRLHMGKSEPYTCPDWVFCKFDG